MMADPGSDGTGVSPRVPLRVLIVEDSSDDALLLLRELERGGYEPAAERVDTPEAMRRALEQSKRWDVVFSDWRMPRFSAREALELLREASLETPFIIVSGKVGEEAAVEAMRAGAHDYVMKGNLARLCATVERGLKEAHVGRGRRRAEEERDRLFEFSPDLLCVAGLDGYFKRVNPAFEETLGYSSVELLAKPFIELVHPEDRAATMSELESLGRGVRTTYFENRYLREDGSEVWLEWKAVPNLEEELIYATARNVTERKRTEEELRQRDAILRAVAFAAERFLKRARSWEESIEEVLEQLGLAASVSRVYIFENYADVDGEVWGTQRYEWVTPGVSSQLENPLMRAIPYRAAGYGRWMEILNRGEPCYGHTREFPAGEQPELRAQDILSIVVVPIYVEGRWWGFIGFDECLAERTWSAAEIEALKAAADTLGAAIQRDLASRTLRESEERYRAVIEHATEGIFLCDAATGDILESNAAFRKMLGYTTGELRNMKIHDLIADDRANIDSNNRLIVEQGSRFLGERRYRRKDGALVYVEAAASLISYGGRRVICDVIRDITERKKAEEALRESQRTLATLMSNLPGMAYRCRNDPDRTMEFVSEGCLGLTGFLPADLIGNGRRSYGDLISPHDREEVWERVQAALRDRQPFQLTYRITTASEEPKWVWEQGRGIFSPRGRLLALEGFITDATERMQAFWMLEERLTTLTGISATLTLDRPVKTTLNSIAAGIVAGTAAVACSAVLIDPHSSMIREAGSCGLPEGYTDAMQASWRRGIHSRMIRVFRSQQPSLAHNARRTILDNPLYAPLHPLVRGVEWDTVYIVPLVARGRALGALNLYYLPGHEPGEDERVFLGAVSDQTAVAVENARLFAATQGKAALEERQHLARELHDSVSQALYGMALGARTARTLLDRGAPPQRVAEWLDYVLSLAEAGLTEMRALIFELRPESLETEGLIVALDKQVEALRARHEISVHATLGEEPDLPLETKEVLYRIVQEALHNTVKHARANSVELSLRCNSESIMLEVSDDGVGFDTSGDFPGHLGLRSMRERVLRLRGSLEIESAPDTGTCIRASIPR
jgi:PAS domain S-box-containing protein